MPWTRGLHSSKYLLCNIVGQDRLAIHTPKTSLLSNFIMNCPVLIANMTFAIKPVVDRVWRGQSLTVTSLFPHHIWAMCPLEFPLENKGSVISFTFLLYSTIRDRYPSTVIPKATLEIYLFMVNYTSPPRSQIGRSLKAWFSTRTSPLYYKRKKAGQDEAVDFVSILGYSRWSRRWEAFPGSSKEKCPSTRRGTGTVVHTVLHTARRE